NLLQELIFNFFLPYKLYKPILEWAFFMQASEKQNIYRSKLVIENKAPEGRHIFFHNLNICRPFGALCCNQLIFCYKYFASPKLSQKKETHYCASLHINLCHFVLCTFVPKKLK